MPVAATFTPPVQPDWGLTRSYKPRVLKAEFGDGYAQRAADGINNNPVTLAARWTHLSESEKDAVVNFFVARKGFEAFNYTYEDEGTSKTYVCEEWSYAHVDADGYVVDATFREVFDIA
jgi:phage-related protein